jgi:Tol biopolymer transport system component
VDPRSGLLAGSEDVAAVLTGALQDLAVAPASRSLAVAETEAGFNLTRLPLSADGGRPAGPEEALSRGSFRDRFAQYSSDGRRLAYSSNRTGRVEVWVLDLQTKSQVPLPLPREGLEANAPVWLPDGKAVVVMAGRIGGPRSWWLLSLDGSRAEELPSEGIASLGALGVSPDGRRLLVPRTEGSEIRLHELDLVTRTERRLATAPGNTYDPIWSRDGQKIAYCASTEGTLQLWTQPAQGGEPRQLTFGVDRMRHASFSPDGRWIYVQPSHRNIWRVPTTGGPLEQVTRFPESGLFLEEPTLAPDGHALVYSRWNGGASIWLLTLGSSEAAIGGKP